VTPWRLLFAHLRKAWFRVALTAGGVALAVFLLATLRTLVTSLEQTVKASGGDRVIVSSAVSLFVFLPSKIESELRSLPGVREVTHWTWFGGVYIDAKNMFGRFATDPVTLRAVYGDRSPGKEEIILTPEEWEAFEADRSGCVVGEGLSEQYGFRVGDQIELTGTIFEGDWTFNVCGVYRSGSAQIDSATMFFQWDYLDEKGGRRGEVSTYTIALEPGTDLAAISKEIDARYESSDHRTRTLTEAAFNQMFVSMWGNVPVLLSMIGGAVLFAAFMIALNTMLLHGQERRLEVGVLKALGFPSSVIVTLFVAEGMIVCGLGGQLGVGAAHLMFNTIGVSWLQRFFPAFQILPETEVLASGIALLVGAISGAVPAWIAARTPVVEALARR
jgi:putative ABC transport system permease protein